MVTRAGVPSEEVISPLQWRLSAVASVAETAIARTAVVRAQRRMRTAAPDVDDGVSDVGRRQ
jgi:hypothetical protein